MRIFIFTAQLSSMTMTAGQGSMLQLQTNMQHSPLGISIINTHGGSVSFSSNAIPSHLCHMVTYDSLIQNVHVFASQMSPFSMNGLPSPGYQCPTSVYQPTPQQVYSLTQTGQQVRQNTTRLNFSAENVTGGSSIFSALSLS